MQNLLFLVITLISVSGSWAKADDNEEFPPLLSVKVPAEKELLKEFKTADKTNVERYAALERFSIETKMISNAVSGILAPPVGGDDEGAVTARLRRDLGDIQEICEWSEKWAREGISLEKTKANRVLFAEAHSSRAKKAEAMLKAMDENNTNRELTANHLFRIAYCRNLAEQLERSVKK